MTVLWFAALALMVSLGGSIAGTSAMAMVSPTSSCSCECVEGIPQTLCGSVHAAQQQTWVCPPSYTCPVPSATQSLAGLHASTSVDVASPGVSPLGAQSGGASLAAPHPQAENCRAVRVWHRQLQAYTGVNICDVQAPSPPN